MNEKNKTEFELSGAIKTVRQAEDFCAEISFILNNLYNVGNTSIDQILTKHSSKATAGIIKKILINNKVLPTDFSNAEKILNALIDQVKRMKIIKLTLAIDPNDELVGKISAWVNENMEKNTLLDISRDESILGGAILSIDGVYKDFSLKKKLSDIFVDKKQELFSNISSK